MDSLRLHGRGFGFVRFRLRLGNMPRKPRPKYLPLRSSGLCTILCYTILDCTRLYSILYCPYFEDSGTKAQKEPFVGVGVLAQVEALELLEALTAAQRGSEKGLM